MVVKNVNLKGNYIMSNVMGIPEVFEEVIVDTPKAPVHPIFNKDKAVRDKEMSKLMKVTVIEDSTKSTLKKLGVSLKGPRNGSKLSTAVEVVKSSGKDDKESCLVAIIEALGVKRGNATIYYSKAVAVLNSEVA